MADSQSFDDDFETPQLPARPFVLISGGVAVFLAISLGALWSVFALDVPGRTELAPDDPPPPRLESHPARDLEQMLLTEHTRLNAVATGEIPIGKAMAIIAARGASAYDPIAPSGGKP